MQLNLSGHHCEITPALRQFVTEKFENLNPCGANITKATVVLTIDKFMHIAEVHVHMKGAELNASATAKDDMYAAVDEMMGKLERQIKKHHDIVTDHHLHDNNGEDHHGIKE